MFGRTRTRLPRHPRAAHPAIQGRLEADAEQLARVDVAEFKDAWLDAAVEVAVSYQDYDESGTERERAGLWQRYLAALDREQQAARALQAAVGA